MFTLIYIFGFEPYTGTAVVFFCFCSWFLLKRQEMTVFFPAVFLSSFVSPLKFLHLSSSLSCCCAFRGLFFLLTEKSGAVGFLSLHIVLLLREVRLILMSSASVARRLRLSTVDLLAFAAVYALLSLFLSLSFFRFAPFL